MANNTYDVEALAPVGLSPTPVVTDDGSGNDWLVMTSSHTSYSEIRLDYFTGADGVPTQASGFYQDFTTPPFTTGNRLVVSGVIENARGSVGRDFISGNIVANILYGDPTADGPGGADSLFGDEGDDRIYGGAGADLINGAEDDDRLFGGTGADTVYGGSGRDTIEGGAGADDLDGGDESGDTLSYVGSTAGVRVSLFSGSSTVGQGGHAEGDRINGFANILGSDFSDRLVDERKGNVGFVNDQYNANTFHGFGGNDTLRLGGFDDTGYGGSGSDTLDGENGTDRLDGGTESDTLLGGAGDDLLLAGDGFDYLSGETGADRLYGGAQRDRLYGGAGTDTVHGGDGNDLIFANDDADHVYGGDGDDDIAGQRGADRLHGGAGADTFLYFTEGDGGDRVFGFTAADRVEFQLPFGTPAIGWDNSGALGADRARLVDTGTDVELRINFDGDPAIEFRVTFVGVAGVLQSQIDL